MEWIASPEAWVALATLTALEIVLSIDNIVFLAVVVMMLAAGAIGRFVDDRPTVKMLALSFLVLIGVALLAEGLDAHIPKAYIYFAMAFSLAVEMLNLRLRGRGEPVRLKKEPGLEEESGAP